MCVSLGVRSARPSLTQEQRAALVEPFLDDITLLEEATGEDFGTWRKHRAGDSYHSRRATLRPA